MNRLEQAQQQTVGNALRKIEWAIRDADALTQLYPKAHQVTRRYWRLHQAYAALCSAVDTHEPQAFAYAQAQAKETRHAADK
jgi:hypothetical protein